MWPLYDTEIFSGLYHSRLERESPYGKFKQNYLYPARDIVVGLANDFLETEFMDLVWIIFFVIVVTTSSYLFYRFFKPRVVKGIYHVRGIHMFSPEAAVPGSPLVPGSKIPSFMVEICRPGLLTDTFMGYGIRLGEVLVMPMHVYASACVDGRVMLSGRVKISVSLQVIESRKVNDVVYSLLDVNMWAKLGTQRATALDTVERSVPVSVHGREGTAAGYATKSPVPHILTFSGSTLPGYSGSAYVSNGGVYGMHIGVAMEGNIGVSMQSVVHEISRLIKGEKRVGRSFQMYKTKAQSGEIPPEGFDKTQGWDPSTAAIDLDEEEMFERYSEDPKARGKNFDAWLRGESVVTTEMLEAFSDMSITQLEGVIALAKNTVADKRTSTKSRLYSTQGPVSFGRVLEVDDEEEVEDTQEWCVKQIVELRNELSLLKARVETMSVQTPVAKTAEKNFVCTECKKAFATKLAMIMHSVTKHVQGESAFSADHQVEQRVQSAPFLGKTSLLTPKKKKSSPNTSSTTIPGVASTSSLSSLSKTKPSPKQLVEYLEILQGVISGLKAETLQ